MVYGLRLITYADDKPEMQSRIQQAIESAGGRVKSVSADKTSRGALELTFGIQIEDTHATHDIVGAVERLRCVAVMRVTEPRPLKGGHWSC